MRNRLRSTEGHTFVTICHMSRSKDSEDGIRNLNSKPLFAWEASVPLFAPLGPLGRCWVPGGFSLGRRRPPFSVPSALLGRFRGPPEALGINSQALEPDERAPYEVTLFKQVHENPYESMRFWRDGFSDRETKRETAIDMDI